MHNLILFFLLYLYSLLSLDYKRKGKSAEEEEGEDDDDEVEEEDEDESFFRLKKNSKTDEGQAHKAKDYRGVLLPINMLDSSRYALTHILILSLSPCSLSPYLFLSSYLHFFLTFLTIFISLSHP